MGQLADAISARLQQDRQERGAQTGAAELEPDVLVGTIGFVPGADHCIAFNEDDAADIEQSGVPIWGIRFTVLTTDRVAMAKARGASYASCTIDEAQADAALDTDMDEATLRTLPSVPLLDATVLNRDELGDDERFQARSGLVVLPDRVTMASARQIGRVLRIDLSQHRAIIFDMSRIRFLDDSAAVTISDLIHVARTRGAERVIISGMPEDVGSRLHSMALLDDVPEGDFAPDLDEAKQKLRQTLLSLS
ncbi:MAG: sodium-independent anion transporter [Chloroflexi bacterium]|nr:sodium-independent anion transporter [Chloroflexota bacterium]